MFNLWQKVITPQQQEKEEWEGENKQDISRMIYETIITLIKQIFLRAKFPLQLPPPSVLLLQVSALIEHIY